MPKRNSIRWKDSDIKRIDSLVRRFNYKLGKLAKDPKYEGLLPERAKRGKIRKQVSTRGELNMQLNSLKRFLKEDATNILTTKQGYKILQYDKRERSEKIRIRNIQKAYEKKRLGMSVDKGTSSQTSKMGLIKRDPKKMPETRRAFEFDMKSLDRQLSVADREEKLSQYRINYLEGIKQLPNYESKIKPIIDGLSDLELVNMTVKNPKLVIDFYYDEEQSEDTRASEILAEWESTLNSE